MAHSIDEKKCTGCTACATICPVHAISGEKGHFHTINTQTCIDCSACGRLCMVGAILNAESVPVLRVKKSEWIKPQFSLGACIGCGACATICPAHCISMEHKNPCGKDDRPSLSLSQKCISCERCSVICPVNCITMSGDI